MVPPSLHTEMRSWRHFLHEHAEMAFEERETAAFVADRLSEWGLDVARGVGGTGVVGTLRGSPGDGVIGLRAELDALAIEERSAHPYRSRRAGVMHACGHDGHMAMLLGAARHLARTGGFAGTVRFLFQPAEENEGGALRMIEDGMFERFPMSAVYALHNTPTLGRGRIACRPGPLMAAYDRLEVTVSGTPTHAATPHLGVDCIGAACRLVSELQGIVPRTVAATEPTVLSVTQVHGGETWNVLPARVVVRGTVRAFSEESRAALERGVRVTAAGVAAGGGVTIEVAYDRRYPVLVNHAAEAGFAMDVASEVVGTERVDRAAVPQLGSEDFAFWLQQRAGAYLLLGAGRGADTAKLHTSDYDFDDDLLPLGASFWVRLVQRALPAVPERE